MDLSVRSTWSRIGEFLRTPSLARSVMGLLAVAFSLLLAVNVVTFVMSQRTAQTNDQIETAQAMRRDARTVLIATLDAETAQRGFLLTGRSEFLQPYRQAQEVLGPATARLHRAAMDDPSLWPSVRRIEELATTKQAELASTLRMAREGRIGPAIQAVRSGQGKVVMDDLRAAVADFDQLKSTRIAARSESSERLARATVAANVTAALLVLTQRHLFLAAALMDVVQQGGQPLDQGQPGVTQHLLAQGDGLGLQVRHPKLGQQAGLDRLDVAHRHAGRATRRQPDRPVGRAFQPDRLPRPRQTHGHRRPRPLSRQDALEHQKDGGRPVRSRGRSTRRAVQVLGGHAPHGEVRQQRGGDVGNIHDPARRRSVRGRDNMG